MELLLLIPSFLLFVIMFLYIRGLNRGAPVDVSRLPYHQRVFFFTRSEQAFFNILNAHLDARRHTIFPKVRLADFIEVDAHDHIYDRTWWNKIRPKHVDFLIWDLVESKIVLAIELDGYSHNSVHMQERDGFVDDLYETVGVRLERVEVGSDFKKESVRLAELIKSE